MLMLILGKEEEKFNEEEEEGIQRASQGRVEENQMEIKDLELYYANSFL